MSLFADLTFRALIVAVDDFGRYEADPLMLKAALFPRRSDVTPEMVRAWVEELASEGCVAIYSVDGIEYLELSGWESHRSNGRRAAKSKYPGRPESVPSLPRKSEEIPDDPAHVSEIRPSDVLRLTSDEYRVAGSDTEAAAEPAATAAERGLTLVEEPRVRAGPAVPPDAATFAEDFRAALLRVHDGFKPPSAAAFESWRQDARRMLVVDKRTIAEARELAAWLFAGTDEGAVFWRSVVLSVPKFREKYEQMKAKARVARDGGKGAAHHGSALLAWANS